ncbi:hypothetical protein M707_02625 [Arthrobacter sp. AK-YN10]|nr:hypothetical protein M707_02625 [Arthrobacter sp. AK-YN10]
MSQEPPLHYRYTIDVDERGYAQLMQLVMKYGTGTGEGGSTSIELRLAMANAEVRTASYKESAA